MSTPAPQFLRKTFVASLWIGVLGPPLIWAAHLQILYTLVKFAERGHSFTWFYTTSAVCFALILSCGALSWRNYRQVRGDPADFESNAPAGRTRFLALIGIVGSAFFCLVILATGAATHFFKASWG